MRTKLNYLFIIITSVILYSCGNPKPKRTDFIGNWTSSDGSTIKLYKNGSCEIKNLDYKKIYSFKDDTLKILNRVGTWEFVYLNDEPIIDISYKKGGNYEYEGEIRPYLSGFHFSIAGEGLLENKPPWHLYMFIGDPDDIDASNKYKFIKD